jgi:hypothetical protein
MGTNGLNEATDGLVKSGVWLTIKRRNGPNAEDRGFVRNLAQAVAQIKKIGASPPRRRQIPPGHRNHSHDDPLDTEEVKT